MDIIVTYIISKLLDHCFLEKTEFKQFAILIINLLLRIRVEHIVELFNLLQQLYEMIFI